MSGPRPRARLLALAAALAAPALYARWIRPRLLTWGATPDEATGAYLGDELVPDPDGGATMATTLPAPPERVWPWLVQMGGGRGGWYGWDWLDNDGEPSADRILPQWQHLDEGQHLHRAPKGPNNWFTVVVVEPNHTLVLQASYGSLTGQGFDPRSGPRPCAYVEGVWGFHLRPAPGAGPVCWSVRATGAARDGSPGRTTCCWGNRCTSSCRPASSRICAPGSVRRCDVGRGLLRPCDAAANTPPSSDRGECLPSSWPWSAVGPHDIGNRWSLAGTSSHDGHEETQVAGPARPGPRPSQQGEGGFELLRLAYCLQGEVRDRRHWNTDDGAEHQERHVAPAPEQLAESAEAAGGAGGASFLTNSRSCFCDT